MNRIQSKLSGILAEAKARLEADKKALDEVRILLKKADERRVREPQEARKWDRVLSNLEKSLDHSKARYERSLHEYSQLEGEIEAIRSGARAPSEVVPGMTGGPAPADDAWDDTMHKVEALNLEQASELQAQIDAGEIRDAQLEAGLALANQRHAGDPDPEGTQPRRQLVLRRAIDKISKQQFDSMTLDEIKVVLACHSLLTSRLEPTSRDQRLRRIMDGAIKILQRKKAQMEGK